MLLAEDRLDVLLERLAALAPGDRHAVLAKLSRAERAQVARLAKAPAGLPAAPVRSPVLSARIADTGMLTEAARDALNRAVGRHRPAAASAPAGKAATSLLDVFGRWLSPRG